MARKCDCCGEEESEDVELMSCTYCGDQFCLDDLNDHEEGCPANYHRKETLTPRMEREILDLIDKRVDEAKDQVIADAKKKFDEDIRRRYSRDYRQGRCLTLRLLLGRKDGQRIDHPRSDRRETVKKSVIQRLVRAWDDTIVRLYLRATAGETMKEDITKADIDKAMRDIPVPTCYADYKKVYQVLAGGGFNELHACVCGRVWAVPDGCPKRHWWNFWQHRRRQ